MILYMSTLVGLLLRKALCSAYYVLLNNCAEAVSWSQNRYSVAAKQGLVPTRVAEKPLKTPMCFGTGNGYEKSILIFCGNAAMYCAQSILNKTNLPKTGNGKVDGGKITKQTTCLLLHSFDKPREIKFRAQKLSSANGPPA